MAGPRLARLRVLPHTLTSRLVVTVVALVALVSLLLSGLTTLAMRSYLTNRVDQQVLAALHRGGPDPSRAGDGPPMRDGPQGYGTLVVDLDSGAGGILDADNDYESLDSATLQRLEDVPEDGEPHAVEVRTDGDVAGGDYRVVIARDVQSGEVAFGLPATEIGRTLSNLLLLSLLLALGGVALAGVVGTLLVRRQLRPLRTVAGTAYDVSRMPLHTGGETIGTRVPERYTDATTEVGQVGSALNTLLDHVDEAFEARDRSEQQVRQFVADASHELRTPLATIHGYAELSRRTPDDAPALSHAMTKVGTQATRMSGLVEDLLLLARLDQGRPLEREEVDLTRMLLELVTDARVVAPDQRWRLSLPEEPITVTGDEHRLQQVVSNLLSNARRHTPAGTTVTASARAARDPDGTERVEVSVHDDGPGVPENLRGRVFERFTRGDTSRTRASGDGQDGAGLGLSLVQAIVAAHGGRVELHSRPGDTTFTVSLPDQPRIPG